MKHYIYLSGPMTGYPETNYPLFNKVAADLRRMGHQVYNPAEFKHSEETFPIRRAFAEYCTYICEDASAIVLLPGWEHSKGAAIEHALAKMCDLAILIWGKDIGGHLA